MLRAMTLNLNYRMDKHGPWARRREAIVRSIAAAEPDVVALQAVHGPRAQADQANELAARLPGHGTVVFEAAVEDERDGRRGSAFVARRALADLETLRVTAPAGAEDPDPRVMLRARLVADRTPTFVVYNLHFSWVESQALAHFGRARAFLQAPADPALLLGDLNALPDSRLIAGLREAGWSDAWARLHPQQSGFTFESDRPDRRIDYVFVNAAAAPWLRDIRLVSASQSEEVRLSDHLGLLVTLGDAA